MPSWRKGLSIHRTDLIRATSAVLALLCATELLVRFLALDRTRPTIPDAGVGRVVPQGTFVRYGAEGFGTTRYSNDGEIATPYASGPPVVVLGDSHTEAFQVHDHEKFVSVAERHLHARGKPLDLRNFGASGYTVADYVWLIRQLRQRLHPVAFVIQLNEWDFTEALNKQRINHFVLTSSGSLEFRHDPTSYHRNPPPAPFFGGRSALLNLLAYRWRTQRQPQRNPLPADLFSQQAALLREAAAPLPLLCLWMPYSPYFSAPGSYAALAKERLQRALPLPILDLSADYAASARAGRDPRTFSNELPFTAHLNAHAHALTGEKLAAALERILP